MHIKGPSQRTRWNTSGLLALSLLALAGCGGGGGDDGGGGGNTVVDPSNPNEVMNNVLVKIGGTTATQQTGNLPAPSADPDAPVASTNDPTVTTKNSSGSQANVEIDAVATGAICAVFTKVAGSSSVLVADLCPGGKAKRPVPKELSRTNQTLVVSVQLEEDFESTSQPLCFDIALQDESGLTSDPVEVCLTLVPTVANNAGPVANAGADQTTSSGVTVQLSGADSFDPDGPITTYQWTQTGGTPVTLNGANTASATFTAPQTSELETLTFRLTVTDSNGASSFDDVTVDDSPVPILTGELRFTMTWDAQSDMDLYVQEPSGDVIYYGNSFNCGGTNSTNGGCLDVDDVSGFGPENIIYVSIPVNGTYCVATDQYTGIQPATDYTLTVNFEGQPAAQFSGSIPADNGGFRWYVITINNGQLTSRAGTASDEGICPFPSGAFIP